MVCWRCCVRAATRSNNSEKAMKRLFAIAIALGVATAALPAQQRSIAAFFDAFTTDWIRMNPDQATSTRFFTGEEQRRLERQITPVSKTFRQERIALAKRGLTELATFNRASLSDVDRTSADVMEWQLQRVLDGE